MNQIYKQIGDRVKARRVALGMSQQELADSIDVKWTSITNLEAGRQCVPLDKLYGLCECLELSTHSLIPDNNVPAKTETITVDGQIRQLSPKVAAAIRAAFHGD